jgi:hypothetical protein
MTDREIIISLYRQENQAMVEKDIVCLNRILAPTMKLHHMTGYVQPKQEWIDQVQNGEMKYFSSNEEQIKDVRIMGNRASLVGQNRVKASVWSGAVMTWPLQMKVEFAKNGDTWEITNQVASTY